MLSCNVLYLNTFLVNPPQKINKNIMQQFADHTIPYDYLQYNIENILNVQIEGTAPPDNVKIRNLMAAIHLKKCCDMAVFTSVSAKPCCCNISAV